MGRHVICKGARRSGHAYTAGGVKGEEEEGKELRLIFGWRREETAGYGGGHDSLHLQG
jgi:hypothetical protein